MTSKQKMLYDFITTFQRDNDGVSPSFIEMREALGLSSKSGIYRLLRGLEEQGFIRRLKHRARAIEVVKKVTSTTLYGFTNEDLAVEAGRRGLVLGRIIVADGGRRAFAQIKV